MSVISVTIFCAIPKPSLSAETPTLRRNHNSETGKEKESNHPSANNRVLGDVLATVDNLKDHPSNAPSELHLTGLSQVVPPAARPRIPNWMLAISNATKPTASSLSNGRVYRERREKRAAPPSRYTVP